jgi:hypothetical protein
MTCEITWTKYGGAKYRVAPDASYDDLQVLFHELAPAKYLENISFADFNRQKDIFISEQFSREEVVSLMNKIKNRPCEILSDSKRERFLIYNIAKIFGYETITIKEHEKKLVSCNEFSPGKNNCGCDYAPPSFWKYHLKNNYEDTVSYSLIPWTKKLGVRIN